MARTDLEYTKKSAILELYNNGYKSGEIALKTQSQPSYVLSVINNYKAVNGLIAETKMSCLFQEEINKFKKELEIGKTIYFDVKETNFLTGANHVQRVEIVAKKYPHIVYMESGRSYTYYDVMKALGLIKTHPYGELRTRIVKGV